MDPFNPLLTTELSSAELLATARRTLQNVVESYHRTYDVFAELLQNAVDAVDQRRETDGENYVPRIWVDLDLGKNSITVCDNGIGITAEQYPKVLAPNVSFKDHRGSSGSKRFRGHKGVGLAFLAYGFNLIRLSTRVGDEPPITGELAGGRRWVTGNTDNPPVVQESDEPYETFNLLDRGTAVTVRLDETTTPRSLPHIATSVEAWEALMRVQTALGRVYQGDGAPFEIETTITVRPTGAPPNTVETDSLYLFPHRIKPKELQLASAT